MSDKPKNPAAVALGSIKTEKKAVAAKENAKRPRPKARKAINDVPCTCGHDKGDDVSIQGHKSRCLRGRAVQRAAWRAAHESLLRR